MESTWPQIDTIRCFPDIAISPNELSNVSLESSTISEGRKSHLLF